MPFRYHEVGALVQENPKAAHKKLKTLFKEYGGNAVGVAESLGVRRETVFRWIKRLVSAGYDDPRGDQRGTPGRKAAVS